MDKKKDDEFKKKRAAKGGDARAMKMTPAERRAVASKAARKRWGMTGDVIPKAVCGSEDRPLRIGNIEISCYVLEDGTRVLSQASFLEALGRHPKANVRRQEGEEQIPAIIQGKAINQFISKEILEKSRPIQFQPPAGGRASGYRAELLPDVCEVYLKARDAKVLPQNQEHVARQAEILIRGLAHIGIIALVDEATGYQEIRARNALATILERFIAKELRRYQRAFPLEFYEHMYRLRKWHFDPESVARPGAVANYTVDLTYARMAPELLDRLKQKVERRESGRLKHHMHRWLTEDAGHPALKEHIAAIVALMKISDSWDVFMRNVDRAFPKFGHNMQLALPLPADDDEDDDDK